MRSDRFPTLWILIRVWSVSKPALFFLRQRGEQLSSNFQQSHHGRAKEATQGSSKLYAWGEAILIFVVLVIVAPSIPQSQEYHDFADRRELFLGNTTPILEFFLASISTALIFLESYLIVCFTITFLSVPKKQYCLQLVHGDLTSDLFKFCVFDETLNRSYVVKMEVKLTYAFFDETRLCSQLTVCV